MLSYFPWQSVELFVRVAIENAGTSVGSRIKQTHQFTGYKVNGSYVGSFEAVAVETRQSKVLGHSPAAMFSRDEVIRFVMKDDFGLSESA